LVVLGVSAQRMQFKLIILDPGHFHASLVHREMYPWLDPHVAVYAPEGPEVQDYLQRVALFNSRAQNPTHWQMDLHLGPDSLGRMLRERPGDIVVITGRNRHKIDRILASLSAGLNVLADKPWILSSAELPKLEEALAIASRKGVAAYDIMTERYEVTSELQRALVNAPDVFGTLEPGTAQHPSITARSVHHVMKVVEGVPLRRPAWFFDIDEYGEGLADVGTHVVDLVQWTAFPDQLLDYHQDVRVTAGRRWPLVLSKAQFAQVTGESEFPSALVKHVHNGQFDYDSNNAVEYTLRGAHVKLEIVWNWEAPSGAGDVYEASFRGSKARVELRQATAERNVPELYIVPASAKLQPEVFAAVKREVEKLQDSWPGLSVTESRGEMRLVIPEKFRVSHEAHFAQVTNRFFEYVRSPESLPKWERNYMLAKYISTKGVEAGHP
jgi:predicted dehydrogenase